MAMATVDLKPLHAALPEGLPDVLREMAEFLFMELAESSVPAAQQLSPDDRATLAWCQTMRLSDEFGGTYVPKGVVFRLTPRNRQMCAEFRGDYRVLARKYKMSEQQVRNIVDRWQRLQFLARQGDIFGGA